MAVGSGKQKAFGSEQKADGSEQSAIGSWQSAISSCLLKNKANDK
ncbi:MAG: hypothetical protein WC209_16755 [Ignavibacteriaceae bacterium]